MLIGGGEGSTFDPACVLRDSSGKQIQVVRTGTTSGTFTGLSRYTQYQLVAYAGNSAGSVYSNSVAVWTLPENPTITKPVVSNVGRLGVTITPGVVTDDGGKAITEIETYIKGGSYGNTLTSIGKGTSVKSITDLKPNTSYQVITRATNGLTEHYSDSTTFTTIGNPPTITDVYASNITTTSAIINYTATYDYNASFKNFVVKWRYPGSTTWTTLSTSNNKITNVSNLNTDTIEYMITITDNWNRSVTSAILTYRIEQDLSNEISELNVVANSDDTYTVSATWSQKVYNKIDYVYILGQEDSQQREEKIGSESITSSGILIKTKQYKNKKISKTFYLMIKLSNYNWYICKSAIVKAENYEPVMTIIKSGKTKNADMSSITKIQVQNPYTEVKKLRRHDIIKLSRSMRYICIDSRGTLEDKINVLESKFELATGKIVTEITIDYNHISGSLYQYSFKQIRLKTSDGSTIRIRNNGWSIIAHNIQHYIGYELTLNGTYQAIDISALGYNLFIINNSSSSYNFSSTITVRTNAEFDFPNNSASKTLTKTIAYPDSDVVNNHLLEIQVFDQNNNNISQGKPIKLLDGSDPICPYGTTNLSATNGSTTNPQLSIYSNNGLPLVLDLGSEQKISKIKIWRKYNSSNSYNKYSRNYIIGRNKNKEICYIFYDSNISDTYLESSNGKEFIVK